MFRVMRRDPRLVVNGQLASSLSFNKLHPGPILSTLALVLYSRAILPRCLTFKHHSSSLQTVLLI